MLFELTQLKNIIVICGFSDFVLNHGREVKYLHGLYKSQEYKPSYGTSHFVVNHGSEGKYHIHATVGCLQCLPTPHPLFFFLVGAVH